MRVFLTGGSGALGQVRSRQLQARGDIPVCLDVRRPRSSSGLYVKGSMLDRETLPKSLEVLDWVVYIAAWHGTRDTVGANRGWGLRVHRRRFAELGQGRSWHDLSQILCGVPRPGRAPRP